MAMEINMVLQAIKVTWHPLIMVYRVINDGDICACMWECLCVCVWTCACMHNIVSYFKIKMVCMCLWSFIELNIHHMEFNTLNLYALVVMDMWYL